MCDRLFLTTSLKLLPAASSVRGLITATRYLLACPPRTLTNFSVYKIHWRVLCYVAASTTIFRRRSLNYTGYQSSNVFHLKLRLLLSTSSEKISHPTCVTFCVTMRHLVACVRPPRIFCVSTAAELLSAHVLFDMSPPTHGTVCLVLFAIVTIFVLLNLNLKRTYLNKLLLTVHTSHIVVTAPTNSFLLHTARYKFYLLTYLLT